jgi:hypothetical protein
VGFVWWWDVHRYPLARVSGTISLVDFDWAVATLALAGQTPPGNAETTVTIV